MRWILYYVWEIWIQACKSIFHWYNSNSEETIFAFKKKGTLINKSRRGLAKCMIFRNSKTKLFLHFPLSQFFGGIGKEHVKD